MQKINCEDEECIRAKGSNALIYGFAYHDIFGDILRTDHYSQYSKSVIMSLLGFNSEILLKGIIMTQHGTEPWEIKKNHRQGHSLVFLLSHLPESYLQYIYDTCLKHGYDQPTLESMLSELDTAFVDFRYNYENLKQDIIPEQEVFLKCFWEIICQLGHMAQTEYIDKYV